MEKEIYIVRHGQTEFNRQRIVQGSGVDIGLNATGQEQARLFHRAYEDISFEVVITSTLRRTHETMAPFLASQLPWEQHPEINEISWGIHEGKASTPGMITSYQAMIASWAEGDLHASLPQGESAAQLIERVDNWIDHMASRPERRLLVCTHGRTMRCLISRLKGQPPAAMEEVKHANTGLYVVHMQGRLAKFLVENDTTHLDV